MKATNAMTKGAKGAPPTKRDMSSPVKAIGVHTSSLRIAFANTFVKTFGKWMYTKWWQQNYYFKFKSILLM